ncbi:MAG: lysoplasmalogenase [Thermodesulfobacteriota bacterium]
MTFFQLLLSLSAAVSAGALILSEILEHLILVYIFKPLTMVLIITLALTGMSRSRRLYGYTVLLGLLFSLAGDILLMLPSKLFLQGLISFLIAHIFYILAFSRGLRFRLKNSSWLPFLLFGFVVYGFMLPSLGEMTLPVLAYMMIILVMGWRAYEQWSQRKSRGAWWAFIGAVLFIISDTALGINRFRLPFEGSTLAVLGTYFPAQWFIAMSVVWGDRDIENQGY